MIKSSFGLTETGSFRSENQDAFFVDEGSGLMAVADGLGGLPNGRQASRVALEILRQKLDGHPETPMSELLTAVNEEARKTGFGLDESGFGTTLTLARVAEDQDFIEIGHVGDSAAILVRKGQPQMLTVEHTVAARMVASQYEAADEAIPLAAHHTLTQCIGQDLYIDPQVLKVPVAAGDRLFLFTDGITKPLDEEELEKAICSRESIDRICQNLTFLVEVAGSPDNYTVVAVEFA